jgi:hypothetical protein
MSESRSIFIRLKRFTVTFFHKAKLQYRSGESPGRTGGFTGLWGFDWLMYTEDCSDGQSKPVDLSRPPGDNPVDGI